MVSHCIFICFDAKKIDLQLKSARNKINPSVFSLLIKE